MPLKLLIIAHLLADFIFQPTKLIEWKKRHFLGIFVHVLIFALLSLILLAPYLIYWETWVVIGAISLVHFLTDKIKIAVLSKYKKYVLPFLLDQAIHLASILIGAQFIPKVEFAISDMLIIFFLLGIYLIYIFFILFLQKSKSKALIKGKIIAFTLAFASYFAIAILL
ncbi:DUF3307 domain-containing protein [Patescibacteria group bacterium]